MTDRETLAMTISVRQLAHRWRYSIPIIRRAIRRGEIPHIKLGRGYRIPKRWVDDSEWTALKESGRLPVILAASDGSHADSGD